MRQDGMAAGSHCASRAIGYRQSLDYLQRCRADPASISASGLVRCLSGQQDSCAPAVARHTSSLRIQLHQLMGRDPCTKQSTHKHRRLPLCMQSLHSTQSQPAEQS